MYLWEFTSCAHSLVTRWCMILLYNYMKPDKFMILKQKYTDIQVENYLGCTN